MVFNGLLNIRDSNNGIRISDKLEELHINDTKSKDAFVSSLKRLERLGYIYIDKRAISSSQQRNPNSIYYAVIRFKDTIVKTKVKTKRDDVMANLEFHTGSRID